MQRRVSFTIPAGAGAYAPEIIYLNAESDPLAMPDDVEELVVNIEAIAGAGANVAVDLLKPGGRMQIAGDWLLDQKLYAAAGIQAALRLGKWAGVRIRGKSGGAAGNTVVSVAWYAGLNH